MAEIVVCGGSVIGLSTAMMLARDGHDVTVLESDPAPVPDIPSAAWDQWDRRGVPQFHQPHNLFARARQVLDADLAGMTDDLVAAGCVWVDPIATLPPSITDRDARPDDDRFRFPTGRRPTVEATFARAAQNHSGVTVRRGVGVAGVLTGPEAIGDVPHITGVRLHDGTKLQADLVVDAMGRRTKLADWLRDLRTVSPRIESEDSGFVYYTRYFTGPERPATVGPTLMPCGSVSVLTLQGDNDTWSATLFCASADTALRGLREPERFTNAMRAFPLQAHWLDGEPISDIVVMAGILDRYRRYVVDDQPVATGVVAVGDAWACTNPSAGRGLSVGLLHAQRLREAIRDGLDDPADFVLRFDAATEADVAPFFRNQIAADRVRFAEMAAIREGIEPPATDPTMAAVGAAMMNDPDVFRGMIETVTCLALPQEVFARPEVMEKVDAFRRADPTPMAMPGPSRTELLDRIAQ
ncbi:MAG: FAD-dependent oxidoreductase [Acidimicrobiia bacterium]